MKRDKQGKLLIKRKLSQRLMCIGGRPVIFKHGHLVSLGHHLLFWLMLESSRRPELTPDVGGKRNEIGETGQRPDNSMFHNSQLFLETPGWWTADEWWMLWRMSGGQREPAEGSIVLRWPVKNSIIPPSHLRLAPLFFFYITGAASQYRAVTISLLQTGLQSWFNHSPVQKYIKQCSLTFRKKEKKRKKSLPALWLQYKSCNLGQYFVLLFDLQSCDHFKKTMVQKVGDVLESLRTLQLIYMICYKQANGCPLTFHETQKQQERDSTDLIPLRNTFLVERSNPLLLKLCFVAAITARQLHAWLYSLCP